MGSGAEPKGMEFAHMDERSVDETLRMIARMPAPEGLEERVKAGLRLAESPGRVLAWPTGRNGESGRAESRWVRSGWARGAAAAAIVLVVAGGGWGIYARVAPAQSAKTVVLPQAKPSGAFSEAGAMRRPLTVTGPEVKGPGGLKPVESKSSETKKGQSAAKKTTSTLGADSLDAAKMHTHGSASHATLPVQ
jgi:hypothetical protein